jgi:hypothetical protein
VLHLSFVKELVHIQEDHTDVFIFFKGLYLINDIAKLVDSTISLFEARVLGVSKSLSDRNIYSLL